MCQPNFPSLPIYFVYIQNNILKVTKNVSVRQKMATYTLSKKIFPMLTPTLSFLYGRLF